MNFITFPVAATNLWPAANATNGSQLLTEWNIKSRETVATDPDVIYNIGPSYVHSERDFEVRIRQDEIGVTISPYTLEIMPGKGVINGYYVETLAPMFVDLVEANYELGSKSMPLLKGNLAIGIRTFFATDATVAGSILVNKKNEDIDPEDDTILTEGQREMFLGVQLVVLPEEDLITPSESPTDPSKVNCDLKLAKFTFLNNIISSLVNYKEKIQCIDAERVAKLTDITSDRYISKIGLNSKKLYAFAGKGVDPETGKDTWEDVTDSVMVWDSEPEFTDSEPVHRQATIVTAADSAYMIIPHKQVYGMIDQQGNPQYYQSRVMELPIADYYSSSVGFVNSSYTNVIKELAAQVDEFMYNKQGKQIMYIDSLYSFEQSMPPISQNYNEGDYVLVRNDYWYASGGTGNASDVSSPPATMYVVVPGLVKSIKFITSVDGNTSETPEFPSNISGVQLRAIGPLYAFSTSSHRADPPPVTDNPANYPVFFSDDDVLRGTPGNEAEDQWVDYFFIRYFTNEAETEFTDYYYGLLTAGPKEWSEAVVVTGEVQYATEETIGGFRNVSSTDLDQGYVGLDTDGKLKLLDYSLLRSGTLAYQLGSDIVIPSSASLPVVQQYFDEYVNNRVAFPSESTISSDDSTISTSTSSTSTNTLSGPYPPIINVYVTLHKSDAAVALEFGRIDSRFETAVCLHIQGDAGSNVILNISDCEKLMIDPNISGSPTINIFRTNLYYDPIVLNYIKSCQRDSSLYGDFTGFRDLKLWYSLTSADDPKLTVNGMTVSELDSPIITTDINYWVELGTAANDNDYLVALKSVTFSSEGDIIGVEVLAANNSTDNIEQGDKIVVGDFILPQGTDLIYPQACMTRAIKVAGEFTTAYFSDGNWYVTDNSFTLQTGIYDPNQTTKVTSGTVAFHSRTALVRSAILPTSISVWEPNSFNLFRGGAIS